MDKVIWTWLKDGQPRGFFESKRSLLISYDLIPLRGLDNTRDDLNEEGRITTGHLVESEDDPLLFVPFRNGVADIEAIDWGCGAKRHDHCLWSLCFFVSFSPSERYDNKLGVSDSDNENLREYNRRMSSSGRGRRPLARLKSIVEAILADLGFQIKPVKFVEVSMRVDRLGG